MTNLETDKLLSERTEDTTDTVEQYTKMSILPAITSLSTVKM